MPTILNYFDIVYTTIGCDGCDKYQLCLSINFDSEYLIGNDEILLKNAKMLCSIQSLQERNNAIFYHFFL